MAFDYVLKYVPERGTVKLLAAEGHVVGVSGVLAVIGLRDCSYGPVETGHDDVGQIR